MGNSISALLPALKEVFGFEGLRDGQKPIVKSIMDSKDTLAILKTSGGKSLCYQLPAIYRGGLTLVVSPLISLMKDQVDSLNQRGVSAAYVNSALSTGEIRDRYNNLTKGKYRLFYVSPERFQDEDFQAAIISSGIHTVAIDEAHCASQWGHDFRPQYSKLGVMLDRLEAAVGKRLQRIAFTATATPRVQQDIIGILKLQNPEVHQQGFDRENLNYQVVPTTKARAMVIEDILRERKDEAVIVYCTTVKKVQEIHKHLASAGIKAVAYHGRLSPEEKNRVQDQFISGKAKVLISTSAFGMGVDKADVRLVIHAQMPGSIEAWYQEAGRAGRDGLPAKAVLLYKPKDRWLHRFFIENASPPVEAIMGLRPMIHEMLKGGPQEVDSRWISKISRQEVSPYQVDSILSIFVGQGELSKQGNAYALESWNPKADYSWVNDVREGNWEKLNAMQQWCETLLCRRWNVLKYFGAKQPHARCGNCDTCEAEAAAKQKHGAGVPYVRVSTMKALAEAVSDVGTQWKGVLLGVAPKSEITPTQRPWYGRFASYAVGDLERWVGRLSQFKVLTPEMKLSSMAEEWVAGKEQLRELEVNLCSPPPKQEARKSGDVSFDLLRKWRKRKAYSDDISELVIATEAMLRKIYTAQDYSDEALHQAGFSGQWISTYGPDLQAFMDKQLAAINELDL